MNAALQVTGVAGGSTKLKWTLPQQVMLGGYHELTDTLAIMGNLGWQDWSEFGDVGAGRVGLLAHHHYNGTPFLPRS